MAQCLVFKYRGSLVVNLEDLKDDNVLLDEVVKMLVFLKSLLKVWDDIVDISDIFCNDLEFFCCIEHLQDIHFWNFSAQTCFRGDTTNKKVWVGEYEYI